MTCSCLTNLTYSKDTIVENNCDFFQIKVKLKKLFSFFFN